MDKLLFHILHLFHVLKVLLHVTILILIYSCFEIHIRWIKFNIWPKEMHLIIVTEFLIWHSVMQTNDKKKPLTRVTKNLANVFEVKELMMFWKIQYVSVNDFFLLLIHWNWQIVWFTTLGGKKNLRDESHCCKCSVFLFRTGVKLRRIATKLCVYLRFLPSTLLNVKASLNELSRQFEFRVKPITIYLCIFLALLWH